MLFTRAKKKIVTFTSLHPTDIIVDGAKSKGVQMFRSWLEYCQTGVIGIDAGPGGSTESPFEDHVVRIVESLGYEAVPQVGTAGYRIDIGVRHPDWKYGYVAGVECDGAAYHSSRSARDRDRLRQEILERLGWTLYRIWSTDWYQNPNAERERLKLFLDKRMAFLKAQPPRTMLSSFNDLMASTTRLPPAPRPTLVAAPRAGGHGARQDDRQGELLARNQALPKPTPTEKSDYGERKRVKVGSKVTFQCQDGQKETLKFTISASMNDPGNGILRKDVPLAKILIDLEEGEEFEFQRGNSIHPALILNIA